MKTKEKTKAIFPRMNKQNTMEEYREELFAGSYYEDIEIMKEVVLSADEYDEVTSSFLSDSDELWEKIGGRKNTEGIDYRRDFSEEERNDWLKNSVTMVCRVSVEKNGDPDIEWENRKRVPFLVNTEGHRYARYVGFLMSDIVSG